MNEETKEILDSLNKIATGEYYPEDLLYYENCQKLLDYIVTRDKKLEDLQRENLLLKDNIHKVSHCLMTANWCCNEKCNYDMIKELAYWTRDTETYKEEIKQNKDLFTNEKDLEDYKKWLEYYKELKTKLTDYEIAEFMFSANIGLSEMIYKARDLYENCSEEDYCTLPLNMYEALKGIDSK